ncbi:MAG TPA: TolC family protein [Bacteroidota bacterium]|nr:TolC family protein [Bacteroidota bacterium]
MINHRIYWYILLAAVCVGDSVRAAVQPPLPIDTIAVTLEKAEEMFLANNLQLLASKYSINAAEAAAVQARLWSNPNISISQNLVNQETGRWLDVTSTGNTEIAVQQLILLAGKRGKQVRVAEIGEEIAGLGFYDLLRTLKAQLRTDFYALLYLRQTLRFYDESIPPLQHTVAAAEESYRKGSMLLSEVLRLKSLLLTLQTGRLDILNQITSQQQDLQVILNVPNRAHYLLPRIEGEQRITAFILPPFEDVVARALDARPDLKMAAAVVRQEEANLALQRALAVPDLTVGGQWSRAGNYIPDYYAVSVSIDLPLFNRNQGNIAVSENTLAADKLTMERTRRQVEREVSDAYEKLTAIDRVWQSFDTSFPDQYARLVENTVRNYQNRNMTVIEFTDFFESYRASIQQYTQLESNRSAAIEDLNYKAGADVVSVPVK